MSIRITLELIFTAVLVVVCTWIYMRWYADAAATLVGYEVAVFVLPPVAGIAIGAGLRQITCVFTKDPGKLWQFSSVGAISAIALPLLYLWAVYQPH